MSNPIFPPPTNTNTLETTPLEDDFELNEEQLSSVVAGNPVHAFNRYGIYRFTEGRREPLTSKIILY